MTSLTVAVTGITGSVGGHIRPILTMRGHRVIIVARDHVEVAGDNEEVRIAQLSDVSSLERAVAGADLIVHLAGIAGESSWASMLEVNIDGTRNVLEAARLAGVGRVLLASSNHAVGMRSFGEVRGVVEPTPAPDTYYGVSKAAAEALGRLYGARFGMLVVSARIGTVLARPVDSRTLATWLSPHDAVRLIEATGTTTTRGGHIVWAVSNNSRTPFDLTAGRVIGFNPEDDAQRMVAELGLEDPLHDGDLIGGGFTSDGYPVGGTQTPPH